MHINWRVEQRLWFDAENDKPTVLALREISQGYTNFPDEKAMEDDMMGNAE